MADRLSAEYGQPESRIRGRRDGSQMQTLLGEFKGLYENRLRRLDEGDHGDDTLKVLLCHYHQFV
jgi:hypothetical protein